MLCFRLIIAHGTGNNGNGEGFSNEVSVTEPYFNCGPRRMTDVLQCYFDSGKPEFDRVTVSASSAQSARSL
ncbi:hypothetical protein CASFOL_017871 [Castilleja foliolosa]|uniref:Uncharacterized protein n=1 Tax=Castilleja foliolosa TaxID=1961234 RepID=A0ABD3DC87_9LAMI